MTFREIITWPLRQVDRLNPLASGAGYMLRNYPTLWRTAILKIIWYLFIAHLALWLAGWLVSQSFTIIPTSGEILSFSGVITALAFLIGFGWFVSVWQTPLIKRTFGTMLLTWGVYAAFIYGLATTTQAYFAPVSVKVAGLYDPRYMDEDAAALADPLARVCAQSDFVDPHQNPADPRDAVRRLHAGHPDHYILYNMVDALFAVSEFYCQDLRAPWQDTHEPARLPLTTLLQEIYGDWSNYRSEEFEGRFREYFYEVRSYYHSVAEDRFFDEDRVVQDAQLDSRLRSVQLAHFTTSKKHHMRYAKSILQPGTAIFAAVLALVLLTLEVKGRRWLDAILNPFERFRDSRGSGPGLISRINARFIKTRPVLWQLRLPGAITLMVLVLLSGWFAVALVEWINDLLEDRLYGYIGKELAAIILIVGLLIFLVTLVIALMQVQRRYFQLDLRRHRAGAQFFLALFFPVLAASLIGSLITVMEIGDEQTGHGVVWYAAAICAYLATTFSWSQTFLGLRRAIVLAAVFAAMSGFALFVLMVASLKNDEITIVSHIGVGALLIVCIVGWLGKLDSIKRAGAVVLVTYAFLWSNLGVLVLMSEYLRDSLPDNFTALTLNLVFVLMAVCLFPLFNRLQEIATAPAND